MGFLSGSFFASKNVENPLTNEAGFDKISER